MLHIVQGGQKSDLALLNLKIKPLSLGKTLCALQ